MKQEGPLPAVYMVVSQTALLGQKQDDRNSVLGSEKQLSLRAPASLRPWAGVSPVRELWGIKTTLGENQTP